jgi:hypothetical protein
MGAVTTTRERSGRLGIWAGIAFVVLFVAGFLVLSTPSSSKAKDTVKWQRWWLDSGHRAGAVIGAYLMVLGLLAFLWFLSSLRDRLGEGGGLAVTFGSVFVAMGLVSALIRAAIPGGKIFASTPVPGSDFARQFDNIGMAILLVAGALAAGGFLIAASYLARQNGLLPGWLTIAGYLVGVLQLAAGLFFPFVLFVLWVLVATIVLLRRSAPTAATPATSSAAAG